MAGKWSDRFENELVNAEKARSSGKEGRARVCTRRAAGIVAEEYLTRQGSSFRSSSAYEYLKSLQSAPELSDEVKTVVEHFLIRVTLEYDLPIHVDLIADARWLAMTLLLNPNSQ